MTATERLRAMLDERGVEWWQSANTLGCIFTRWYSPIFGDEVCAMENGEEGLVLFDHFVTPEQAIAATLGRDKYSYEQWREISNAVGDAMEYAHNKAIECPDKADPLWNLDEYVNRILKVAFKGEATLGDVDATSERQRDAVEVVRCRDCEGATDHCEGMDVYWCEYLSRYVGADMFCAWA